MGTLQKSGFARTSGFENHKLSGFANYSRPVLIAPQQRESERVAAADYVR